MMSMKSKGLYIRVLGRALDGMYVRTYVCTYVEDCTHVPARALCTLRGGCSRITGST